MKIDITDKATQMLILSSLKAALAILKSILPKDGFDRIADGLLNEVEGKYEEGSFRDMLAEAGASTIREFLGVPDSNPEN